MAYAAAADVQGYNTDRTAYSTATKPTLAQVNTFIANIAAEIDAVLAAAQVATPVASPAAFVTFLLSLNAVGAAALAEAAQFPEFDGGVGTTTQSQRYWAMYQKGLAELKDGTAIDPAAAVSTAATLARGYLTDNPTNPGNDGTDGFQNDAWGKSDQPLFSMGRQF